jgi:predicted SnoaL-like aldol condensation-catalyzing enzyme
MSEQERLVRRLFDEIINAGDIDAADELLAADYVDHGPMGDMAAVERFKGLVQIGALPVPQSA